MNNKFAITVGLPCAGKSAFCEWLNNKQLKSGLMPYVRVCPDNIRRVFYGTIEVYPGAEEAIWTQAHYEVKAHLDAGDNVIVDATHVTKESRKRWIQIAREYKIPLDMYWINTGYSTCQKINEEGDYLPRKVIETMASKMEYPEICEGRGVIEIYTVNPTYAEIRGSLFERFRKKNK